MKRGIKLCFIICINILLTACVIGNGHICGPQTPVIYCDKEALEASNHPLSPLDYWNNKGVTTEEKLEDWMECDGREDGNFTPSKRLAEEKDDFSASRRMYYKIQRCMLKKSYHYLGQCDNEMAKASPGCGAP